MSNTSSVTHNLQTNCVFCEIVAGRSPDTKIMFETENILIIKDIKPASDHHYLALPKNHITNAKELKLPDKPLSKIDEVLLLLFYNYFYVIFSSNLLFGDS